MNPFSRKNTKRIWSSEKESDVSLRQLRGRKGLPIPPEKSLKKGLAQKKAVATEGGRGKQVKEYPQREKGILGMVARFPKKNKARNSKRMSDRKDRAQRKIRKGAQEKRKTNGTTSNPRFKHWGESGGGTKIFSKSLQRERE